MSIAEWRTWLAVGAAVAAILGPISSWIETHGKGQTSNQSVPQSGNLNNQQSGNFNAAIAFVTAHPK
jgi:hypothetical protein